MLGLASNTHLFMTLWLLGARHRCSGGRIPYLKQDLPQGIFTQHSVLGKHVVKTIRICMFSATLSQLNLKQKNHQSAQKPYVEELTHY